MVLLGGGLVDDDNHGGETQIGRSAFSLATKETLDFLAWVLDHNPNFAPVRPRSILDKPMQELEAVRGSRYDVLPQHMFFFGP